MSSLLRRIQKAAMKKAGYRRNEEGDILSPTNEIVRKSIRDKFGNTVVVATWPYLVPQKKDSE